MSWIVSGMAVCRCTSFDSAMHLLFRISKPLLVVLILNKSLKYLVTNKHNGVKIIVELQLSINKLLLLILQYIFEIMNQFQKSIIKL